VGIDVTPKRFTDQTVLRQLDVATPIPNLFMTGQDTVLCGVTLCQVRQQQNGLAMYSMLRVVI
jgi:hypothetical protein